LLWNYTQYSRSGIDVLLAAGFQKKRLIEGLAFSCLQALFSAALMPADRAAI